MGSFHLAASGALRAGEVREKLLNCSQVAYEQHYSGALAQTGSRSKSWQTSHLGVRLKRRVIFHSPRLQSTSRAAALSSHFVLGRGKAPASASSAWLPQIGPGGRQPESSNLPRMKPSFSWSQNSWNECVNHQPSKQLSLIPVSLLWSGIVPFSPLQPRRDEGRYARPASGDLTRRQIMKRSQ